jgi:excisionase family DNA binding protein
MQVQNTPIRERLTCSINEACAAIPCGRTHLYKMIRAGLIKAEKFGDRTLVIVASLPGASEQEAA